MKKVLGLDIGTNSIGWAVLSGNEVNNIDKIEGVGSRIIPMSQDILGNFDRGSSVSQTAERTGFRGTRRLRERHLLRRERLHRVLHLLGFLPSHYEKEIDFEKRLGQYMIDTEPKIAWKEIEKGVFEFVFQDSFNEMLQDFSTSQPLWVENGRKIPYDWTIYYLRKKALKEKIEKEELAWLILNFNQKRGYYQLRGEDEDTTKGAKTRKFFDKQKVKNITDTLQTYKGLKVLLVELEDGSKGKIFKKEIPQWIGVEKNIIVTVDLDKDGKDKLDEDGLLSQKYSIPNEAEWETEWKLIKLKTEKDIQEANKTVGSYIYDTLLQNPQQKIKGKLVRTIERKFYKEELIQILEKQKEFHPELRDSLLYTQCIEELYPYNDAHRNTLQSNDDFTRLIVDDIIFYQRPLKSKKHLISNCPYEHRVFKNEAGNLIKSPIKCIAKSHPLFQEFRLWQFIHNLRVYERVKEVNGKLQTDVDVTTELLPTIEKRVELFEWLNDRKAIKQETLLQSFFQIKKKRGEELLAFRWNYVEDKEYPCNETRGQILICLDKAGIPRSFLTKEIEIALWHILYSVEDKKEIEKALQSFAVKHSLGSNFVEAFLKFPPFKKDYGAYSVKAISKLLSLMRIGKYWDKNLIAESTLGNIQAITKRLEDIEYDEKKIESVSDDDIPKQVLRSFIKVKDKYAGLNTYQACYAVYRRHSEASEVTKWRTPDELEHYIKEFKQHSLRNPIVEQVVTETLRTVRDIWKQYGEISEIHVELGREMKNPADKRAKMSAQIAENENTNMRIKALLAELKNHNDVENVRPYSPNQQEILKIFEEGVLNSNVEIPDDIQKISRQSLPTRSELVRYKLWLEQKYRSPYTGEIIPLGKLFTHEYQIEHIIPQSRYFDDSLSNKVICESVVNANPYKDNLLGYEFIKNNEGRFVHELSTNGRQVKIFSLSEYEQFVKENYRKNRSKMRNLLLEDIPDKFIERQLNDTRYISRIINGLLSNIVREEGEQEVISKHVVPCTGGITSRLKQEWGLNDIWNRLITPRFERMNRLTNSNHFGQWENKEGKRVFQTQMPLELQKGFNKKRIDHRHHALDAIVIACATRSHVNYLNNESARTNAQISRHDLKNSLCYKAKINDKGKYEWRFIKPWGTFTQDAYTALDSIIVSFKQNLRVINKTVNKIQSYKDEEGNLFLDKKGKPVKKLRKQIKGDNWAIRKSLHKDTVAGHVNLRFIKNVSLSQAIDQWESLVDKDLKKQIKKLSEEGLDKNKIRKFFAAHDNKWNEKDISKPQIYYFSDEKEPLVASRVSLDTSFNSKKIESITDSGIRQILLRHLKKYNEEKNDNIIEHPDLAFTPEAIEEMNKNIKDLNNGKDHLPIWKVRTYEPKGNKFNVGNIGNKKSKYVEAAKGTNLYFAIYADEEGKRTYETIPFNVVVERLKQGLKAVPETNEKGDKLLFSLSPNDLVYVPTEDEIISGNIGEIRPDRVYKMVSATGYQCFFIPSHIANPIVQTVELGANNKSEKSWDGLMVKQVCSKIRVSRLGKMEK